MTPHDLPWAPAIGQTALYVVASNAERVLCADKARAEFRTLWTADGQLIAQSGPSLTLAGVSPAPRRPAPACVPLDADQRLTLEALARAPADCLALANNIGRPADKIFLALLALARRGYAAAGPADGATPRLWRSTPSAAEVLRAAIPAAAPAPVAAPIVAIAPKHPAPPSQMSLF